MTGEDVKPRVWIIAGVLIVALGFFAAYLAYAPCQTIIPAFDSSQVESAEARELRSALQVAHMQNLRREGQYATLLPFLPTPLRVASVSGKWASIVLSGPVPDGQLENAYGAAWQEVYAKHHHVARSICVFVHFSWGQNGINTGCCSEHL